jgi:hypothetical protein
MTNLTSISQLNGVTFGARTLGSAALGGYPQIVNSVGGYTDVVADNATGATNPGSSGVIGSVAFVTGGPAYSLNAGGTVLNAVQYTAGDPNPSHHYIAPTNTTFGTFGYITLNPGGIGAQKYYVHGFSAHALLLSKSATLTVDNFNGTSSNTDPYYFEILNTYDLSIGPPSGAGKLFPGYPAYRATKSKTWTDAGGISHKLAIYHGKVGDGLGHYEDYYAVKTGNNYAVPYLKIYPDQGQTFNQHTPTYPITFSNHSTDFQLPCYAEGTRILTTRGDFAVEDLAAGDEAVLAGGGTRPVIWIGARKVRCTGRPDGQDVRPVRIRQGAFGEGLPRRDLVVSPGHAIFVDRQLVPAAQLLNGATIVQEDVESVRYFHVELDAHDVLLAEGLACESYLDDGNRQAFANHDGPVDLFERLDTETWDHACAPVMTDPYELEAVRSRLVQRAEALGWRRITQPALQVLADGAPVAPLHASGRRWWFLLPAARELVLSSAADVLGDLRPELHDRRRLGVAVSELRLNGAALDLAGESCRAGFYPLENHGGLAWRWTDGRAHLAVETAEPAVLEVEIVMVAPTWERPAARLEQAA